MLVPNFTTMVFFSIRRRLGAKKFFFIPMASTPCNGIYVQGVARGGDSGDGRGVQQTLFIGTQAQLPGLELVLQVEQEALTRAGHRIQTIDMGLLGNPDPFFVIQADFALAVKPTLEGLQDQPTAQELTQLGLGVKIETGGKEVEKITPRFTLL